MKILISGGSGFLGRALTRSFLADGHAVYVLTRGTRVAPGAEIVSWDARTVGNWVTLLNEIDIVIHLAGKTLASWPWTTATKRAIHDSRVLSGLALTEAIQKASPRPRLFVQQSGINHYGLRGDPADETTPPADDFLAQLTVEWEAATQPVEEVGVRRVALRTAVVLDKRAGLMPLMALPVFMFLGGPMGSGQQAMPWIHIDDWVGAVRFLVADGNARGAYNLIAPTPATNAEFTRQLAQVLHRPCWFPVPAFLPRTLLGEMSVLILEGRIARPTRLLAAGYKFRIATASAAFSDLFGKISKE